MCDFHTKFLNWLDDLGLKKSTQLVRKLPTEILIFLKDMDCNICHQNKIHNDISLDIFNIV